MPYHRQAPCSKRDARLRSEWAARARFEHIPVFGTFESGMTFTLTEWLELRGGVSWVPPVENLNVLSPQLGLRAEF